MKGIFMIAPHSNDTAATSRILPGNDARRYFPHFEHTSAQSAYLDTAASALKPSVVIERMSKYLSIEHANIHRGAYRLSANATQLYDAARLRVKKWLQAEATHEAIFTRNATEAINLVASSYGSLLQERDTILTTVLEHHSNIVPWQLLKSRSGIHLKFCPITEQAMLHDDTFIALLRQDRPKLVTLTAHSNAFGTIPDLDRLVAEAHGVGAVVLVDATQAVVHGGFSLQDIPADFVVFSGHKVYGPTGIGCLLARRTLLESMPPFMGGGDMIEQVSTEGSSFAPPPARFEAGTPAIAEAIGLASAIDFLERFDSKVLESYERDLLHYASEKLSGFHQLQMYGPGADSGKQRAILSFSVKGVHPHDLATIVDDSGVQIRAGHHCAMPALKALGVPSTGRLSFGVYSTREDIDQLCEGIRRAITVFGA